MINPIFSAAIRWHRAGLAGSSGAGSVQMTHAILEELAAARALLAERTGEDPDAPFSGEAYQDWLGRAMDFRTRTTELQEIFPDG